MKRLAGALAIVWALANLVVAYLFLTNAFVAKTAIKEGPLAQAALLLGGLLVAVFTALLARLSLRILAAPDEASGA